MKRTRRWLLIFAALVGLMAHAGALKATSLIFGKPSTKPTTTTSTSTTEASADADEVTDAAEPNSTVTKRTLTGIPQIDYIWDPNLPRELNGLNLSAYPFLNSVPTEEDIDFKCEESLHDGFYASTKFGCQLYHHCLFGVRYDFLCANFTAFDQRTFICHFVSEVDCKNSAKYWHRNDALYVATTARPVPTTTTVKPPPTTTDGSESFRNRPGRPLRRPLRRRRPQAADYYYYDDDDYEDDYYEERMNRRRKQQQRPRTRRPAVAMDYAEYDDERYAKRPAYERPRTQADYADEKDFEYERRPAYNERPRMRARPGEKRRPVVEEKKVAAAARDTITPKAAGGDRRGYVSADDRRRPLVDDDRRRPLLDDDRRRPAAAADEDRRRPLVDEDRRRPLADDDRRSAVTERRRNQGTIYDRRPPPAPAPAYVDPEEDADYLEKPAGRARPAEPVEEAVKVKPSGSGGIFDRPRVAPKIRRPVPLSARDKYEYVSTAKPAPAVPSAASVDDAEYYDDYEDVPPPPKPRAPPAKEDKPIEKSRFPSRNDDRRQVAASREESQQYRVANKRPLAPTTAPPRALEVFEDEEYDEEEDIAALPPPKIPSRTKLSAERPREELATSSERASVFRFNQNRFNVAPTPADTRQHETQVADETRPKPADRDQDRVSTKEPIGMQFKEVVRGMPFRTKQQQYPQQPQPKDEPVAKPIERENYRPKEKETYTVVDRDDEYRPRQPASTEDPSRRAALEEEQTPKENVRPIVRVVKRPFLPSRGGNPYLPRGLQPVGAAAPVRTEEPLEDDEPYAPTVAEQPPARRTPPPVYEQPIPMPQTTHQPSLQSAKSSLDEIYDSEYDVTLNDALNPTLKPLAPVGRGNGGGAQLGYSFSSGKYDRVRYQAPYETGSAAELNYSPSQIRTFAIQAPARPSRTRAAATIARQSQSHHYYDDYDF